jgi:hypothetical protein
MIFINNEVFMQRIFRNISTKTLGKLLKLVAAGIVFLTLSIPAKAIETVSIPKKTAVAREQLETIAFWTSTSHPSKHDKALQVKAEEDARNGNKVRPVISEKMILEDRKWGVISHGNSGRGNTNADTAREDAIGVALLVF